MPRSLARAPDRKARPWRTPSPPSTLTDYPQQVLWGDTHLHTDNSIDAFGFATRLGPEAALQFARGDEVTATTGMQAHLARPLARAAVLLIALFAVLALSSASRADDLRPGYMELTGSDPAQWRIVWKPPVASFPDRKPPAPVIPDNCRFTDDPEIGVVQMAVLGSAALACDGSLRGQSIGMPALLGQADMLVRIQPLDGGSQALHLTARELP